MNDHNNSTNQISEIIFKSKYCKLLPIIITITFFVISSYVAFIVDSPSQDSDLLYYFYTGKEIIYGDKENVEIFNAPVGWPVLLAAVDSIVKDPFITSKLFSVIFGSGIVLMSYFIIRNVFGEKVAILGQSLIAVTPLLHAEVIMTHSEMLPTFLIFMSFYFITKKQLLQKHIILCGAFLGLSFMLRPQSLFIAVGTIMFIVFFVKKQKKRIIFCFVLFFLLCISPLLIYNISVTGNLIDNNPNLYASMESKSESNKEIFKNEVVQDGFNQDNIKNIINNLKNYFNTYPENLFHNNSHYVFNLGLGHNNFSTLPFIPFSGILFILGGIMGVFKYDLRKIHFSWVFGIPIILSIWLITINKIEEYFLLPIIFPAVILGLFSIKKVDNNILALLIPSLFFVLSISIVRIQSGWDMFGILIIPSTFSAFFIIKIIPKIILKIQNKCKLKCHKIIKKTTLSIMLIIIIGIIITNVTSSVMLEKHLLFDEPVDYHNLLPLEQEYELMSSKYVEIGEILSKEPNIENKIVMANSNNYAHYANSKFLYTQFNEGDKNDTIESFIKRENWSKYEIKIANTVNIPPDRNGIYDPIPDYLIYDGNIDVKKNLQVLKNPNDPRIPENFELIYRSDKTGIMIYKIE